MSFIIMKWGRFVVFHDLSYCGFLKRYPYQMLNLKSTFHCEGYSHHHGKPLRQYCTLPQNNCYGAFFNLPFL